MIGGFQFLLFIALLLSAAKGDLLNAKDAQACTDLCASCEGTATFEDERCECLVPEDNKLGVECLNRIKREIENFDIDSATPDLKTAERSARCSLFGHRRRLGSADADRVASYFMNGGPLTGSSLLGRSNPNCSPSFNDQITGSPNTAVVIEPVVAVARTIESPVATSPLVGSSSSSACANSQYQPIVSTQWLPNYGMGYNRLVGAYQPFQGSYYPHDLLGATPHMILEIPNELMRATHIPAHHHHHHHPGLLRAAQHSPLVSNLASGTHGLLQRLDNMVSPYTREHSHGNIVSAPHTVDGSSAYSAEPSYPSSNMVGAPRHPVHTPNPALLRQVLAHQNSLLEALSNQLGGYRSQHGAPRMPVHHTLGSPKLTGRCYCPNNEASSIVGAANPSASENWAKSAENSSREEEAAKSSRKDSKSAEGNNFGDDSKVYADDTRKEIKESDDKTIVGPKAPADKENIVEEKAEQKSKRESRPSSSTRKKRGDVKYVTKKLAQ